MEATHSPNTCNHTAALPRNRTSQLCKPLAAILKDLTAANTPLSMLEYFIQYMEEQDALHLLQFWFAVESFKTVAPSPKHIATDLYSHQLTTSITSTGIGTVRNEPECVAASVGTSITNDHMTRQDVAFDEGSANLACKVDATLPYLNSARVNDDPVSSTNEGTRQCSNDSTACNIEGSRNMCGTNSDTLEGKRECPKQLAVNDSDVSTPSTTTEGIHVHQKLLKQLSLSKEVKL